MSITTGDINVIIADDHEIFRDGFRLTLSRSDDIHLVGEAANGRDLIELVEALKPDVVITDIKMPLIDGIAATRTISARHPEIGIIGLSMFDEEDLIIDMLESGARGYLLKNADKEEVIEAIKTVYSNENFYCRHTSKRLAQMIAASKYSFHNKRTRPEFSEKEIEIIQLICQEFTNKEIGDQLHLSVRTVEGYRLKIQERMKVKNSVGLVVYAIQHGLFDPK